MKQIWIVCSVLLLLVAGCSKEDKAIENNGLLGKWKLKEQFFSPGDNSGSWQPVETSQQSIIEFHADNSFSFSSNFQKADLQLNRFLLTGTELNMSSTLNSNTDTWYVAWSDNRRLELSILRCIEGCYYRFVAVR